MTGYVYSLNCAKTKKPFYVGCTTYALEYRLSAYQGVAKRGRTKVYKHIRKHKISFYIVELEQLEYELPTELLAAELKWIKELMRQGHILTNSVKIAATSKVFDGSKGRNIRISSETFWAAKEFCKNKGLFLGGFVATAIEEKIKQLNNGIKGTAKYSPPSR